MALSWACIASAANPQLEIKTNQGTITVELFADKAPKTTANFLKYAKDGFYNGTIFHRVINRFMIQGGGFTPDMNEKTTRSPIENEAPDGSVVGLRNVTGTLAMARTGNPHSATAQFFINNKDNPGLDYPNPDGWGYAVFGKVTKGMDVVFKISAVQTTNKSGFENVPVTPIIIESVTIIPEKK
ncbi:MAG TPA: peptidylprolyl isomerase [Rhodocyclaceae bacterium]|nr:peptidylprolyl isomerase [Rhodocyclaceae bacterium]